MPPAAGGNHSPQAPRTFVSGISAEAALIPLKRLGQEDTILPEKHRVGLIQAEEPPESNRLCIWGPGGLAPWWVGFGEGNALPDSYVI